MERTTLLPRVSSSSSRSKMNTEKDALLRSRSSSTTTRREWCATAGALLGCRGGHESSLVLQLVMCGALANISFVFGRNVGPALLVSRLGPSFLARGMFLAAVALIVVSPWYSAFAKKRRATTVYSSLLFRGAIALCVMWFGLRSYKHPLLYLAFYVFEDTFTLIVMMQQAALSQELLSATDARRVLGLIQLGTSLGAIFAGVAAGPVARYCGGTEQIVLAQALVLVAGLVPTAKVERLDKERKGSSHLLHTTAAAARRRKVSVSAGDAGAPSSSWKKDEMILTLAAYTFVLIVVKTVVEFEYNVLVSSHSTTEEMVTLTGFVYAAAGAGASILNLGGTRLLLSWFGLRSAAYAFPVGLCFASALIICDNASLRSALAARTIDLMTRWSINNTFKSIVWIAVSVSKARAARPYVEATTKKVAAALAALALGTATKFGCGIRQLTWIAVGGCCTLLVLGWLLVSFYVAKMVERVERRHVPLADRPPEVQTGFLHEHERPEGADDARMTPNRENDRRTGGATDEEEYDNFQRGEEQQLYADESGAMLSASRVLAVEEATATIDGRKLIARRLFQRFEAGGTAVRLYLLREISYGQLLSDADIKRLFRRGFFQWNVATQVAALRDVIASRPVRVNTASSFALAATNSPLLRRRRSFSCEDGYDTSDSADETFCWEDDLIATLLSDDDALSSKDDPEGLVVSAAASAAAKRGFFGAQPELERLLGATQPMPRAFAAASLLALGWGVGLGMVSSAAAAVLEAMLVHSNGEQTENVSRPKLVALATGSSLLRRASDDTRFSRRSHNKPRALSRKESEDDDVEFESTSSGIENMQAEEAEQLRASIADAESEWRDLCAGGIHGRAIEAAIRLTAMRVELSKYDNATPASVRSSSLGLDKLEEDNYGTNVLRNSAAIGKQYLSDGSFDRQESGELEQQRDRDDELLAALRALHELKSRLTVDATTWLTLAAHSVDHVRSAVLELPIPPGRSARTRRQFVMRAVIECGGRETTRAAALAVRRIVQQYDDCRDFAFRKLIERLEAAATGRNEDDIVSLLDALRELSLDGGLFDVQDVSENVHRVSTLDNIDSEEEGSVLDAVFDLLDAAEVFPTGVEEAIVNRANAASVAQRAGAFFHPIQVQGLVSTASASGIATACRRFGLFDENANEALVTELCQVAGAYVAEKLYGARQQLLARCVLLIRSNNIRLAIRARDAWKSLKSRDVRSASAVIEFLDAQLPLHLKRLVIPTLDPATGQNHPEQDLNLTVSDAASSARRWLLECGDRIGSQIADLLGVLLGVAPSSDSDSRSLATVSLLRRTRLFGGALISQHLGPLADECEWRRVAPGTFFPDERETYVVARGRCYVSRANGDVVLVRGDPVQEWHALGSVAKWTLPLARACAIDDGDDDVELLVVPGDGLQRFLRRTTPKFAFSLLRSLVLALPKARQLGSQPSNAHVAVAEEEEAVVTTGRSKSTVASREEVADRSCLVITPLEKFLLLRDAKMLRFVRDEHLATLADVTLSIFLEPNKTFAEAGTPTDATLYVLADGSLQLRWDESGVAVTTLEKPGSSFGNTGLLAETTWPYGVVAGKHGAALLALRRSKIHDALRGRRDLAAAVARGFLRTLGRRALQHVSLEEGADYLVVPKGCDGRKPNEANATLTRARVDFTNSLSPVPTMAKGYARHFSSFLDIEPRERSADEDKTNTIALSL